MFLEHSGAGTSGGELEEESWKPPDPELIQKLVSQIEYYLSDENLEHDAFLLKHVRRNKLGFVSVKLLTSFKKVTAAPKHNLFFFFGFSGKTQQLCTCLSVKHNTTQHTVTRTWRRFRLRQSGFASPVVPVLMLSSHISSQANFTLRGEALKAGSLHVVT